MTRSFIGLGFGEAAARLVAFVTTLVIARRLGADSLGIVAFAFAILLYLQRFVDAGIDFGIGIREASARRRQLASFVPPVLALRLTIAMVIIAIPVLVALVAPSVESRMVALYSLTLVPMALGTRWVLTALATTRPIAVARAAGEIIVLFAVTLTVMSDADLGRVPLSQLLGDAVAALMLWLALRRMGIHIGLRWDTATVRPLVRHVAPYVASTLLGLAIFNADLIFLRAFADRITVGLYAAAYSLVSFLINVGATYSLSLIPPLTRLSGEPERRLELYHTAWARAVAVVLPITAGGVVVARDLLSLVFGFSFAAAGPVLAILMLSVPLSVLRAIATSSLMAQGREDILFRTVFSAAIANVAMNFIAVPLLGMRGAALVTVATEGYRLVQAQYHARLLGMRPPRLTRHWRALAATAVMYALLSTPLGDSPIPAIGVGAIVYAIALSALGGVGRDLNGRWQLQV